MKKKITPIFIFSLPRSGSTLLQRILMGHQMICSTAEPWILLPLSYSNKNSGIITEYNQATCYRAIEDFVSNLPNKEDDYYESLAEFVNKLYSKQCNKNEIYFLDKTPRYYLIIPEIARMFPEAKFIFLFRNPVAVLSSVITTWHKGRMRIGSNHLDLYDGPHLLEEGRKLLKDKSITVKYEDLVNDLDTEIKKILLYLDLPFDQLTHINSYNELGGRLGDKKTSKKKIHQDSTEKWKSVLNTRFRKRFAKKYVDKLGKNTIENSGYVIDDIKGEIDSIKPTIHLFRFDRTNLFLSWIVRFLKIRQLEKVFDNKLNS